MDIIRKYAPALHTGFANNYSKEQMTKFIERCYALGYSGFSSEGKSEPRTNDIDAWLTGFLKGLTYACEEAEKKGLEVWLFDEWGYPTGTAGGKVLDGNTRWRSKKLHLALDIPLEQGQSIDVSAPPHFISAAAWRVGRDIFGAPLSEDITVTPQNGRIVYTAKEKRERFCVVTWEYDCFRTVGVFVPDPADDAQGTLDLLSWEAVGYFISQMHESYVPALAKYFGKTVKGFFYDEPFVSYPTPYTFDIFEDFRKSKGYDIVPVLPRMMAGLADRDMVNYRDVCTTRVAEAFFGQMSKWCREHELEMIGHQDLDHSVRTLDSVSGHFFKNSAYNDSPGIDFIWSQIRPGFFADFPRLAGSAAKLSGKEHAISESFAATSSCLYPDYMRYCMEYQIVRGISRFFLMIADPSEVARISEPTEPNVNPLINKFTAKVNRHVALANMLAHNSRPAGRIAVFIPMDAVFRGLMNQKNPSTVSVAPYMPVWEYIDEAAKLLCRLPVDFVYLWKEALRDLPTENGALVTKFKQRIDTIIVPPSANYDDEVCFLLKGFADAGGRVIFIGNAPKPLIGEVLICPDIERLRNFVEPDVALTNPGFISLSHRTHCNGRTCYNLSTRAEADCYYDTGSCDENGVYVDDRLCNGNRSCVGMELYFFLNEDEKPHETQIQFPYGGNILKFDFEKEIWTDIDKPIISERFEAMQLIVYAVAGYPANCAAVSIGEQLCEISEWTVNCPDGKKHDLRVLKDWREFYKGDYTGVMSYTSEFNILRDGMYRIDLGKVCYSAEVLVDDRSYLLAFAPFTIDLDLTAGCHKIRVDVINTNANEFFGTPEAELEKYNESWFKSKIGTDRKYLESGLLGPVKVINLG